MVVTTTGDRRITTTVLATLPLYLAFLGTSVLLLGLFVAVYVAITPYHEFGLIRTGNVAAAWSLGGVVVGLALPLWSIAAHSTEILDMFVWGLVGLVSQLVVFFVVSLLLKGLRAGIEADRVSYGMTSAAFSVAVGILNAGSLTT